jgi:hypothetical protein
MNGDTGSMSSSESESQGSSQPATLAEKLKDTPKRLPKRPLKLKRDKFLEPSVPTMFKHRMKREQRSAELEKRVRARMEAKSLLYGPALREVMPEMGFVSDDAEIRLYRQHMMAVGHLGLETSLALDAEEERLKTADEEYEEALMTLPPNAPKAKELEWIEAHPAMMRQARLQASSSRTGSSVVLLTAKDILGAPHGLCPSRSAANQLQHWVNHSQKFFEQIMSEAKKKSTGDGTGGDGSETVEDNLDDLDGALAQHGL